MPIELKDIAAFTGIEAEDFDTFKETFNEKYVPKEQHGKTLGELNGKALHEVKLTAKEIGIEAEDLKGKQLLEALPALRSKIKSRFEEIEGQKSATVQEVEAKFKDRIASLEQKNNDLTQLLDGTKTELDTFKSTVETEKRQFQINTHFDKAFGGLKFSEQKADEISKLGFKAKLNDKYVFDLSDEGAPVVRTKDGAIIQSKAKAGTPATFDEVLQFELKENKLDAVVDSKKVPNFAASHRVGMPSTPTGNGRQIAPRH